MYKYLTLFTSAIKTSLEYRGRMLVWFGVEILSISSYFLIWTAIFKTNSEVAGFNYTDAIAYFLFVPIIGVISASYIVEELPQEIKDGIISGWLLKPLSYSLIPITKFTASKLTVMSIKFPVYFTLVLFTVLFLNFTFSFTNILVAFIFACLAYVMHAFLDTCLSYVAFWIDNAWFLPHLKFLMVAILGGQVFPISIIPESYRIYWDILPFKYLFYVPVSIAIGKLSYDQILINLLGLVIWFVIIFLLNRIVYTAGIKKYGAYGN